MLIGTMTINQEHPADLSSISDVAQKPVFIDMFAGLGGFHLALSELELECVWASEIKPELQSLYSANFGIVPAGDIRQVSANEVPKHDVLCAGFPCQPFSKAGTQNGLNDEENGNLFECIVEVLDLHRPRYIILENVPNLKAHDGGRTWKIMCSKLTALGYDVEIEKLSPHRYGIPQFRERAIIVGKLGGLGSFKWPVARTESHDLKLSSILDTNPAEAKPVQPFVSRAFDVWQDFLNRVPGDEKIPHPLWSMEFGATYPYEESTPHSSSLSELQKVRGSHGAPLKKYETRESLYEALPSHARTEQIVFPSWKISMIRKNRAFYQKHKFWMKSWMKEIKKFPSSYQKLEWNAQGEADRNIRHYVIQLRPSGVRVKRPTTAPALVASTSSQIPIIGWENRYMTTTECARLQNLGKLDYLPEKDAVGYAALGNAVNAKVIELVARQLLGSDDPQFLDQH